MSVHPLDSERPLEKRRDRFGTGLRFDTLQDLIKDGDERPRPWIIKGIIARGESSSWIAPPGGMKSALMAELAICTAQGSDWHGFRSKGCWNVVYFALERADLVGRRLRAHVSDRLGKSFISSSDTVPRITVVPGTLDLMDSASVDRVVTTVRNTEHVLGHSTGLIIFDTFAKTIAAGGGDEDKAKDQGRVFTNLQRIKDRLAMISGSSPGPHIALVGHTGKDVERGARGSNAQYGDVDVLATITGDDVKTVSIVKANAVPLGDLFSFRSQTFDFGLDEDGDPICVNIVSADHVEPFSSGKVKAGWPRGLKLVHDAVAEAIDSHGSPHRVGGDGPTVQAVAISYARRIHSERYVSGGDGDRGAAERKAWQRSFNQARDRGLISGANVAGIEQIWIVKGDVT